MKKIIALILIFILLTSLCSCGAKKEFDFSGAEKVVVFSGSTGEHIETTDKEEIKNISDIFTSHTFTKKKSSKGYDGFRYNVKWYDASGGLIEEITLMSGQRISYDGYFYDKPNCKCALADYYLDELFGITYEE